jgi:hypothetical protein
VRFTDDTVERIKTIAERDGVTLSAWIRARVDDALEKAENRVNISPVIQLDAHRARNIESDLTWSSKVSIHG